MGSPDSRTQSAPHRTRLPLVRGKETNMSEEPSLPIAMTQGSTPTGRREEAITPRDWIEDFSHENGNYMCICLSCKNVFFGHKRRPICKSCFYADQVLRAEIQKSFWWASLISNPKLQDWAAAYFAWKVRRKLRKQKPGL